MKYLDGIRKINLISMNLFILLALPNFLRELGWENEFWTISIFAVYLFIFFSFWFFLYFIYGEIKYVMKYQINFFNHLFNNKLVLWGIIPFVIYLILFVLSTFYNNGYN